MIKFEDYNFPKLGYIKMPKINISKDELERFELNNNCKNEEYLLALAQEGFDNKVKSGKIPEDQIYIYLNRLKFEYKEITRLFFTDYILLVHKIIKFCRENEILNSPSRGSCGGSLLLYLIDVIQINPIKHNLLFERFISADRTDIKEFDGELFIASSSLPDIDVDSDRNLKYKINEFLNKEYPNKCCAIKNISTFQGKACIKDCYKIIDNATEDEAKEVADLIETKFGKVQEISDALKENEPFKKWAEKHQNIISKALMLNGLCKNSSVHASGVLICDSDIESVMPLELASEDRVVSGYDMEYTQEFSIKLDNLGLKNLHSIKECLDMVNLKMEDIDVNHESIYRFLNNSDDFYGIFQAEESLGKICLKKLKCQNIDDIGISISLGRPGCMKFLDDIVKARENNILPDVDKRILPILSETYNSIIFQEQILALCKTMAGMDGIKANAVRKVIGKKLVNEMPKFKDEFINGSLKNGFDKKLAENIWQTFEDSGNYLFNKSHGTGYAYLTAICAFLKINYSKEYYCCLLNNVKHEQSPIEEISSISKEMPHAGIKLLPPNILKSSIDFTIEGQNLRFGLSSIKSISTKSIEKLNKFRNKEKLNKFQIFHAANEAGIPINILSSLIMVGSLDDMLTETRSRTFMEACLWNLLTDKEKILALQYGPEYNFHLTNLVKDFNEKRKNEKGKPLITDKRRATLKRNFEPYYQIYNFNKDNEDLSAYFSEISLLGYSYSYNLRQLYEKQHRYGSPLMSIKEVKESFNDEYVTFIGTVKEAKLGKSKEKETPYLKLIVEDETGEIKVMMFESARHNNLSIHLAENGKYCSEGDVVIILGSKKEDVVFAKTITIQDNCILTKISDLEKTLDKKKEVE